MFDQHLVETPENISFDYQIAGIGSRFIAILVDSLIQGMLYLFLVVIYLVVTAIVGVTTVEKPSSLSQWIPTIILLVALFVIQFGYYIIFEMATGGKTPGKEVAGLRVVKENGHPLTAADLIIRNLLRLIDFLPFAYGVGVIVMFLNERSKRLGDFAAGTLVVRVDKPVTLRDLQTQSASSTFGLWIDAGAVTRLGEADVELIESYLQRRATLQNADQLGAQIEQRIRGLLAMPANESVTPSKFSTAFLEQVVAAYRTAHSAR